MGKFGKAASPVMEDVFKNSPKGAVVRDLMAEYRQKAIVHLQETIPDKITALKALLEGESDPNSPLWLGHMDSPVYTAPKLLQPEEALAHKLQAKLVFPHQVVEGADSVAQSLLSAGPTESSSTVGANGSDEGYDTSDSDPLGDAGLGEATLGKSKWSKAGAHWFQVLQGNPIQRKLIALSMHEHADLHMISQDLRIWLEMEIPLIEDGNSFGAEVQNVLIKELAEAYRKSNSYMNGCRAHYVDRVKLAQDWVKCPNLMDFPAAIAASDQFDHLLLRSYLRSLLIIYGGLLTRFERNWPKIINPKGSSGAGGMY